MLTFYRGQELVQLSDLIMGSFLTPTLELKIKCWFLILNKLGCVVRMIVGSILPTAECGPNDHRKDAPPFSAIILCVFTIWSKTKKTSKMGTDATLFPRINNKPSILIFLFNLIIFILFIWLNIPMVGQRQYHSVSWINMNEHVRFFFKFIFIRPRSRKKLESSKRV